MKRPIKVMLVDDHAVVRAGFRMLLTAAEGVEVIAEAARGEAACQLYQERRPDVVVMDLSMPGIGGLETMRRIIGRYPDAKILVFSVHDEAVYVQHALNAGARGYITKNAAPTILVEAIQKMVAGAAYMEQGLLKARVENDQDMDYQAVLAGLSTREFDVFRLLAKGLTVHKVADELCLSHKTVANYATQVKAKLKVSSLAELARIAMMLGVMKPC